MADPDEAVRVILMRGADQRSLLEVSRSGEDYYATVPGTTSHRSYHASGTLHVKSRAYWGEDIYREVIRKVAPSKLIGIEPLASIRLVNEPCWHEGRTLNRHRNKKRRFPLHTIMLDASKYPENCTFSVWVGLAKSAPVLAACLRKLCAIDRALKKVRLLTLPRLNGPMMFACVFQITRATTVKGNILRSRYFVEALPSTPGLASASIGKGAMTIFSAKGDFGTPKPLFPRPPILPLPAIEGMPEFNVQIKLSPFDDPHAFAGPLKILGLPSPHPDWLFQPIAINPNLQHYRAADMAATRRIGLNYPLLVKWTDTEVSKYLQFSYGVYGGQSVQQTRIDGIDYQIEITSLNGERLDKHGVCLAPGPVALPDVERWIYEIKIIVLTGAAPTSPKHRSGGNI